MFEQKKKKDKSDLKKATTTPTLSARDFFDLQRLSKVLNNPLKELTSQGMTDVLLRPSRKKWTLRGLNSRPHACVSPSCEHWILRSVRATTVPNALVIC